MLYRNPIDRILSSYQDRFKYQCGHNCRGTQPIFGPVIVNQTRVNASKGEIAYGCPTFNEFLQFALTPRNFSFNQYLKFSETVRNTSLKCQYISTNSFNHW